MQPRDKNTPQDHNANQNTDRFASSKKKANAAHEEAMHDIEQDADLSIHSPNDDLDEGETARLGEDKTDLI